MTVSAHHYSLRPRTLWASLQRSPDPPDPLAGFQGTYFLEEWGEWREEKRRGKTEEGTGEGKEREGNRKEGDGKE